MAKNAKISNAVIKRLPRYRRYLHELDKKGVDKISSAELSKLIGYTASQIRQDLNNFGGFGQQGYGYNVKDLHDEISAILGLDQVYHMVIVGGGNLGHAIAGYTNSYKQGFQVEAIFEVDPAAIGTEIGGVPVLSSDDLWSTSKTTRSISVSSAHRRMSRRRWRTSYALAVSRGSGILRRPTLKCPPMSPWKTSTFRTTSMR